MKRMNLFPVLLPGSEDRDTGICARVDGKHIGMLAPVPSTSRH